MWLLFQGFKEIFSMTQLNSGKDPKEKDDPARAYSMAVVLVPKGLTVTTPTKPQHCSVVGHENNSANQPTTKYSVISNNKQGQSNDIYNNNKNIIKIIRINILGILLRTLTHRIKIFQNADMENPTTRAS